jgi:phosphoglycerate dehydrogenase-like enzyme
MLSAPVKVLYLSHAPADVYEIIRAEVPDGFALVTLEGDSEAERLARIGECEVVIPAAAALRRPHIAAAPKLRLVHHQGVGYQDTVDVVALKERGIPLALTPEGTTEGVAEHAVLLMLAVAKLLPFADAELRQGRWHVNALRPRSRQLFGKTIGYVGMGRIGQATAERLRAFGTTGLYCDDLAPLAPARARELGVARARFHEVLAGADFLSLHVPLTPATRHLLSDETIARMRPGAIVINTARGGLIDEAALCRALSAGHIGGAGLDVFEAEPMPVESPLCGFTNVVLTPHISAGTRDALSAKMRALFANVRRFYAGQPLRNQVALD